MKEDAAWPSREQIDMAKELLLIPALWRLLNLPGEPGKTGKACHSPFRKDRHPSFAIYDDGKTAFDFTTGEFYDSPKFFAEVRNIPIGQALKELVELAGGDTASCEHASPRKRTDSERSREPAHRKPDLSKFWLPTKQEIHRIAIDRGLAVAAPEIAKRLGCLKCGYVCGVPAWILSDPSGRNAEARRFGREDFPACGDISRRKAHTLRGSSKSWPTGLGVDRRLVEEAVLICILEGGPDLLACWDLIHRVRRWNVLPITILGRCVHGLHPEALQLLKDKQVRFFPHVDPDDGTLEQVSLIGDQLRAIGCQLTYFDLRGLRTRSGAVVKDLMA